jgi:hypothetical protein
MNDTLDTIRNLIKGKKVIADLRTDTKMVEFFVSEAWLSNGYLVLTVKSSDKVE